MWRGTSNGCACQGWSIASGLVNSIADYETVQLEWPIRTRDFTVTSVTATADDRIYDMHGSFANGESAVVYVPADFLPTATSAEAGAYVLEFSRVSSLRGEAVVAVTTPSLRRIGYSTARIAELQLNARINGEYHVLMQEYYNGHDPITMADIAWSIAIAGPQALLDELTVEAMEQGEPPDEVRPCYEALCGAMRVLVDRAVRYGWWPSISGASLTIEDECLHDKVALNVRHAVKTIPGLEAFADQLAVTHIAGLDSAATNDQVRERLSEMWGVDRYGPMLPGFAYE